MYSLTNYINENLKKYTIILYYYNTFFIYDFVLYHKINKLNIFKTDD